MNLVYFLTIGVILSTTLGEFGQFPFGTTSASISLLDILISLTVGLCLIWQVGIQRKIVLPMPFKILLLFWIWAGVSLLFSGQLQGGLYLLRFILYSSMFWVSFLIIKDLNKKFVHILKPLLISAVVITLLGILQYILYPDMGELVFLGYDPHIGRLFGSFLDPNYTGSFLALVVPILVLRFWEKKKWLDLLILGSILIAILLTFSRSAYLMLSVEIIVLALLKSKKLLVGFLTLFMLLYFSIPQFSSRILGALNFDATAQERLLSWQNGITIFMQNPFLGVGFNNIRLAQEELQLFRVFTADGGNSGAGVDSSLLLVLATTGVVGLLIYLLFLCLVIKKSWERKETFVGSLLLTLTAGLLVNSQFINSLFYPPIMAVMFILLGAGYAELGRDKRYVISDK